MTPSEVEIMNFERSDGFCKNRCPKSKSEIGNCFCLNIQYEKLNAGISAALRYSSAKYKKTIGLEDLKLMYSPSYAAFGGKRKGLDRYSKKSEAYQSMMTTIRLERLLNDNK